MTKAILPLALLLAACSGAGDSEPEAVPVALVKLGMAQQGAVSSRVTLYGIAEGGAGGKQTLSAPAEAIVTRIVAPVGTRVATGDVVAVLTATPTTRLDIAKASADARAADAAFARAQRLRADGLVGDAEVETARAAAQSADATRASLAGRAGSLTLRAQAAGFVESIDVATGAVVQAGAVIASIAGAGDLRARFGIDPTTARSLRPGSPVLIGGSAGRAAFAVPIQSIVPLVDPQTRLGSVFARLPAISGVSLGEALSASVAISASGTAITIPYVGLLDDGGQPYVYVVANGIAHRHDVTVGPVDGDRIAIVKGVAAGEKIVTEGGTAIEDGMKVRTR